MTMHRSYSFKKKLIAISVLQALSINSATAATVTVDNGGDAGVGCTLREAVLLISSIGTNPNTQGCVANGTLGENDIIEFSVPSISGIDAPHIQITQDVSINPGGGPVSITGLGNDRIFNVILSTVSIDNLTISGGSTGDSNTNVNSPEGGAGISVTTADLTVTNSTISGNTALDDGGGIFIAGQSYVKLIDSTVSGNSAGDNGGGVFITDSVATLSLENSSITGNSAQGLGTNRLATGNGGGLHGQGGATILASNSVISGNSAEQQGGGVWSSVGTLSLSGTTVSDNTSSYRGGGIRARNADDVSRFTIDQGSVISGNVAGGNGGGIFTSGGLMMTNSQVVNNISRNGSIGLGGGGGGGIQARAALTLRGSTVSGNSAAIFAGGISVESNVHPVLIEDSVIANNASDGRFGGIQMNTREAAHTFDNVQVLNNRAVLRAGGVYLRGSDGVTLEVNDSTISGNSSGEEGGGIVTRYFPAHVELNRTIVSGNSATEGGGIHLNGGQSLSLNNSAVTGNVSTVGDGGGIYGRSVSLNLNNTTMSDNRAAANGGGLKTFSGSLLSIVNSTLANNSAQAWGGNLYMTRTTFSLSNSIITGGEAPMAADIINTNDGINSFLGRNLVGDSSSTTEESLAFFPPITLPTSVILATSDGTQPEVLDDILLPLADNGGSTLTHALTMNSPAIDVGDNTICAAEPINNLDQRGEARPIGGACDIGAYESSESSPAGGSSFFVVPMPDGKSVIFEL